MPSTSETTYSCRTLGCSVQTRGECSADSRPAPPGIRASRACGPSGRPGPLLESKDEVGNLIQSTYEPRLCRRTRERQGEQGKGEMGDPCANPGDELPTPQQQKV